tara:strand:- start:3838 stop:5985 length:2148 start_codon:yes stop_codon:yes gene_type:complete
LSSSFFSELKRRNVYKVGIAYLVLAWVVVQVTATAVPALHLPVWINSAVFLFGAIGFPFALFFAWEFEITHEGVKREADISPEDSIVAHTGRKLDFIIIGLLVVVAGYFIYESRFETQSAESLLAAELANKVETPKAVDEPEGSSIAVLPFVNMSSDTEQEYFSDGISEEILNVLAKIPKLHVTSRSSAFFYKGTKINIIEVAAKLGVNNILEGSVRKSGNRIRITAQLIEAASDKHLWSETYDRELTDIFAIQDEISAAIVEALKTKLGLNIKVVPRDMSKVNPDAHNEYLKGRFYIENRNQADIETALGHFDNAVMLAPDYAPAWMGKGWATVFLTESLYGNIPNEVALDRAKLAIEKALQLEPEMPEAHGIMALIEEDSFETNKAISHFKKAIELNPNYADALSWYSNILTGQPDKRLALVEKAVKLNPMSILANDKYGDLLIDFGRIDEAQKVAEHMLTINASHPFPYSILGRIQQIQGAYAKAAMTFKKALENSPSKKEYKYSVAIPLNVIGLKEQAASVFEDSDFIELFYWFKGNTEQFILQARALYPRSENDAIGLFIRAQAEARAENYSEAVKYYNLTEYDDTGIERIYSYLQLGETAIAKKLLDKEKALLSSKIDAKIKYWGTSSIAIKVMEIAYLEGNTEQAIANLKLALANNYIVDYDYKTIPMFKRLRQHPDWLAILRESDKRAAEQREIYFKLRAEENKAVH